MTETELIEKLIKLMPRSDMQLNKPFESDSEILRFNTENMLFSTDEFSAEDLLLDKNPYILGYNIAAASISDIYASGGVPVFYAQSLTINKMFTEKYLMNFYAGVADVLKETNTSFMGGDFGKANDWRCCTSVIGSAEKPILRSGAKEGDNIYFTGKVGAGNVQAAAKLYNINVAKIKFNLRNKEAEIIRQNATSCIDTSDGVFNALMTISRMSNVGFEVFDLPYMNAGKIAARLMGIPKELLFLCECGEYELLFTAPENVELPFYKIGKIIKGKKIFNNKDVSKINISAREFEDAKEYLKVVKKACEELL